MRTQTLVKNAIIQVDAAPFKQWYMQHYGVELGQKKAAGAAAAAAEDKDAAADSKVRAWVGRGGVWGWC